MIATLKFTLEDTIDIPSELFFEGLGKYIITAPGISGAVLALVIFNVYEHLELGRKIAMGIGWRSALLVGVLCGLFSDRMIAALEALVGV